MPEPCTCPAGFKCVCLHPDLHRSLEVDHELSLESGVKVRVTSLKDGSGVNVDTLHVQIGAQPEITVKVNTKTPPNVGG